MHKERKMKFTLIQPEVNAVQLTRESVEAHLFDKAPLPEGFTLSGADFHPINRTISRAWFRCLLHQGDYAVCEIGTWRVEFPDGHMECWGNPQLFAQTYKPVE
jgi:hypothetical protein